MHINYYQGMTKNNLGRAGLLILVLLMAMALLAPWVAADSAREPTLNILQGPSWHHPLGTNDLGQDILSRLMHGTRTSLVTAAGTGLLTILLGVTLGAGAALMGGRGERAIMRITDIFLVLPAMLVIIVVAAYLRPGTATTILILSVFSWAGTARIMRAHTLSLKNRVHILAAQTFGAGKRYIFCKHIIPDLVPLLVASFIQQGRRAVFMEASLAFLGLSDPTAISWGVMLRQAWEFSGLGVWNWLLAPGFALSLTIVAFSFVGYALEETMNPEIGEHHHA